jgi:hypothetical protein
MFGGHMSLTYEPLESAAANGRASATLAPRKSERWLVLAAKPLTKTLTALSSQSLQVVPEAIKIFWSAVGSGALHRFSSLKWLAREKAPSSLRFAGALQIRLLKRNLTYPG